MKTYLGRILLISMLAVVSVFCWTAYAQQQKQTATVWEYKVVKSPSDNAWTLSELGKEGWELVSLRTEEETLGKLRQTNIYYYLKRPR